MGAAMLILAGGTSSFAQVQIAPAPATTMQTSPAGALVQISAAQRQSIKNAYAWHQRDMAIVDVTQLNPRTIFVESPGLKERSDYLNVKVKSRTQMLTQVAIDIATRPVEIVETQTRGAAQADAIAQFQGRLAQADQRTIEARTRLAPSLRRAYDDIDMHSVRIPAGVSAEVAAEALMLTGDYEYVSIDWICHPVDTIPNDSLFSSQWHHTDDRMNTVSAWDFTQGSSETIIGVCDSGVDLDHPDLASSLVPGYNSVDQLAQVDGGNVTDGNGHGSLVAGSAAAIGNNGSGVSGVGWNFGIMPIRVSNNADGTAFLSDILDGARWASDNGAYTSNCSFGGADDPATRSSGGHIRLEGHLLVFAAGNDGLANQTNDWEKVTIVGATNQSDNYVNWSHTGIGIDCVAPGVNIRTTNRNGGYSFSTGTSFSAPITAGALMLVHDANPSLSADEVEFILLNSCDDKQAAGEDNQTGWGRINIGRAVEDAIFGPSITNLPFEDTFSESTLSTQWRNPVGTVEVTEDGVNEPSGSYALNLDDSDSIETISMRAGFLGGEPAEIQFFTQHRGVETGESLLVEFVSILGGWDTLTVIESDGSNQESFDLHRIALPIFAMHDGLKLRFTSQSSDAGDDWYIDDIKIQEFTNNELGWEDTFEDGITPVLDWASSNATSSTDASNEPSGTTSALLNNADSMTSADVDVSTSLEVVYYRFYTQHEGVESGESLLVEYKNLFGAWNTLTTIESDGSDQSSFTLTQIQFPFDAYGATTSIRFSADGDEDDDRWFLDSVAISTVFVEETNPCPADLTGDGVLNFFDISAFLSAFGEQDQVADFSGDGVFNFFDISEFLNQFSEGCP
jgi:subtilisin family serine protease